MKHIKDLGPRQLWNLRKQIVVNSLYTVDYSNTYDIDEHECYHFFNGYLDWLEYDMVENTPNYNSDMFWDLFDKYDTYHNLNEYAAAF